MWFHFSPPDGGDWSVETARAFLPPSRSQDAARAYWIVRGMPTPPGDMLDVTGLITGIRAPQRRLARVARRLMPFSQSLDLPAVPGEAEALLLLSLGKEVRLAWPPGRHPWEALHQALQEKPGDVTRVLLYGLAAAALILTRAGQTTLGPWFTAAVMYAQNLIAPLVHEIDQRGPSPLLSRKAIQARAEAMTDALLRGDVQAVERLGADVRGPGNVPRLLYEIGRRLWHLEVSQRGFLDTLSQEKERQGLTGFHAALFHLLVEGARREVVGEVTVPAMTIPARPHEVVVRVEAPWQAMGAWHQYLETRTWPDILPQGHVQWLFPEGIQAAVPGQDTRAYRLTTPPEPEDEDLARTCQAFARALIERARERAVFRPFGRYLVELPPEVGLEAWGVKALAVAATPDALYVRLVTDAEGYAPVVRWSPELESPRLSPFLLNEGGRAVLDAALAALWHDLTTEPEGAFREAPQSAAPRAGRERRPSLGTRGPRPRYFPRRAPVRLRGQMWGEIDDGEGQRRRPALHFVMGHLRRLPPGYRASPEARSLAEEHGVILPPGFTHVRPHFRGGKEGPEAGTRAVPQARLHSLVALMRGFRKV